MKKEPAFKPSVKQLAPASNVRHKLYKKHFRLYSIWASMKGRCYSPTFERYNRYGGRGITVCKEWHDFTPFFNWAMANGYKNNLTIDRIDNDGNYRPDNCRWVTAFENNFNRRKKFCTNGHEYTEENTIERKRNGRVRGRDCKKCREQNNSKWREIHKKRRAKPCPFCNCNKINRYPVTGGYTVVCTKCGSSSYAEQSMELALRRWNRRAKEGE